MPAEALSPAPDKKAYLDPPLSSLFYTQRWKPFSEAGFWPFFFLTLYFPFGALLCVVRVVLFFAFFLIGVFFTQFGWERIIFQLAYLCLGYRWKYDASFLRSTRCSQLIVCNHVSDFDGFTLYSLLPPKNVVFVVSPHMRFLARVSSFFGIKPQVVYRSASPTPAAKDSVRQELVQVLQDARTKVRLRRLIVFAEGAETNGRVGMLRFGKFLFGLGMPVQPMALRIRNAFGAWWPGRTSYPGDSIIRNFLYFFFVPWHTFEYKLLPPQVIREGETDADFADRVQRLIADELGLVATQYTFRDKIALFKLKDR
ncbi:putative Ancient ubiquitous protein 1 [Paratrimastix pyriformis]|uniref:Ancient ubiquitous protein 1 n=1 Tax=Paratrimastix pyriformis TaxID=342808 RepID=A0ABQ8URY8_9EUKA|nr:putative Ancient ubiquitous protein 1 [Paratrimastix pyriformis]